MSQSQQPAQRLPTTTDLSLIQQLLAHYYALSYEHNIRNIEHPWYGFWNHVLIDIAKDTRNLVVLPQFVVWASPEGYKELDAEKLEQEPEQEEPEPEQEPENEEIQRELEAPRRPHTRSQTKIQHGLAERFQVTKKPPQDAVPVTNITQNPQHSVEKNAPTMDHAETSASTTSNAGSIATIALPKDSSTRIADFSILKFHETKASANTIPTKPEHIKATGCRVKVLVEIKRLASRNLEGEEFQYEIGTRLDAAIHDVTTQAALLFEKNKHVKSVIAIAASGNYWRHTILKRENISHEALKEVSIDLSYNDTYVAPAWASAMPLEDSLEGLQKLFKAVRT